MKPPRRSQPSASLLPSLRHDAFKELMLSRLPSMTYMQATYITGSSVDEELSASINNVSAT